MKMPPPPRMEKVYRRYNATDDRYCLALQLVCYSTAQLDRSTDTRAFLPANTAGRFRSERGSLLAGLISFAIASESPVFRKIHAKFMQTLLPR